MTRRLFAVALLASLVAGYGGLYFAAWQLSRPVPAVIGPPPGDLQAESITFPGESGSHTTAADTQRLFAAAREPKALWLILGAAHVDYHQISREEYRQRVFGFLRRALRSSRAAKHVNADQYAATVLR